MKVYLIYFSFLILIIQVICPVISYSQKVSLKTNSTNPFHLGIETGSILYFDHYENQSSESLRNIGFFGFAGITTKKEISFIKLELGLFKFFNTSSSGYFAGTFNHKIFQIGQDNKFYGALGFTLSYGLGIITSLNYIYSVSNFLGLTANLKYLIGRTILIPSVGIKIFNN
ncbi:MAG: hypothetical protein IPL53_01040 [Ignavibacteria bacterium]|nr:hypothetical protein [Ignavibacteria bacterium]